MHSNYKGIFLRKEKGEKRESPKEEKSGERGSVCSHSLKVGLGPERKGKRKAKPDVRRLLGARKKRERERGFEQLARVKG